MAAVTMTSAFLGTGSSVTVGASVKQPMIAVRRSNVVMAKASEVTKETIEVNNKNARREMMFAVAAAAACSVANMALAEEPKRGTPEAKKKYAQVCVTNPTARICRN